ncbi:MAG: mechanosensitive ion channel family protein [Nitrospirae bacterium]|jgi:small-conductance mechanosensitive channel|nr:mechanosensitive ion channel family protein [Nitrospirota bacterium]
MDPSSSHSDEKPPSPSRRLRLSTRFVLILLLLPALLYGSHYLKDTFPDNPELLTLAQITSVLVVLFSLYRALVSAVLPAFADRLGADRAKSARYFLDFLFVIIMLLSVLTLLGKGFSNLAIGGTLLSVILGIAGQNSLTNFFSGFVLAIVQPFRVGDPVSIVTWQYTRLVGTYPHDTVLPEHRGTVASIGMIYTSLIGEDGRKFMLPNAILLQAMILEWSRSPVPVALRLELPLDIPFPKIESTIRNVVKESFGLEGNHCSVELNAIGPASIVVLVKLSRTNAKEFMIKDVILRGILAEKQIRPLSADSNGEDPALPENPVNGENRDRRR